MRFKEFYLTERPDTYTGISLGDDDITYELEHLETSKYKEYKEGNYTFRNYNDFVWFLFVDNAPAVMSKVSEKPTYTQILSTVTKKNMKNKGYATALYEKLIEHYGGILSDASLSKSRKGGSWFLYEKLIKKYPSYIVTWDYSKDHKKLTKTTSMPTESIENRILVSKKERTEL